MKLELTRPDKSGLIVTSIDGLGPVKALINTTECANLDGVRANSTRLGSRNIVLHLTIYPYADIETTRQKTYRYFPIKQKVTLTIETDNRIGITEGIVESNEPDIFSSQESTSISILCPYPYFYSGNDNSKVITYLGDASDFQFPFSNESLTSKLIEFRGLAAGKQYPVYYYGDSVPGIIVHIKARGSVVNPAIKSVTINRKIGISSSKLISYTGQGVIAGDEFVISTISGDKYAKLIRNGEEINILNCLDRNAGWFWLVTGTNYFSVTATGDVSLLRVWFEYKTIYEGI